MKRMTGFGWEGTFALFSKGEELVSAGLKGEGLVSAGFRVERTGFGWFRLVPRFSNYPLLILL